MRAPIVSVKHYVQNSVTQVTAGTVTTVIPIRGIAHQNVDAPAEVLEGSVVKAVFLEYWIIGENELGSFVVTVEKSGSDTTVPSFTDMTTIHAYGNKKNILYTTQGLMSDSSRNPTPILRQWIKIPKGKQRFGLDDRLRINFSSLTSENLQFCGFTLYKSYG